MTRRIALWTTTSGLIVAGCGGRSARELAGSDEDGPVLGAALELERAQVAH